MSSPLPDRQSAWRVSQEVSGFIREDQFELAATSYQVLESADETFSWTLDNWRGKVENDRFIHGETFDEKGREGTFWGGKTEDQQWEGSAPEEHRERRINGLTGTDSD